MSKWTNRALRLLKVGAAIALGTIAGLFVAGFGSSGCESKRSPPEPSRVSPPSGSQAPLPQAPAQEPDAGVADAGAPAPDRGPLVDREEVKKGQPLPRNYME